MYLGMWRREYQQASGTTPPKLDAFPTTTIIVTPQQREALHRQGRVDLAIQAHKQGHIKSFRAAGFGGVVPLACWYR